MLETPGLHHYDLSLLRRAPVAAIRAASSALLAIGAVIVVIALFNRPLARHVSNWQGFSPWWAVAPFIVLFMYGLLKANYEEVVAIAASGQAALEREAAANERVSTVVQPSDEQQRRAEVVAALQRQWLLSHDGITPAEMAGFRSVRMTEWINTELRSRHEGWQLDQQRTE